MPFYCEIASISPDKLRRVPSPAIPENQATDSELESEGELHSSASRVLMRALWLSRLERPDLSFIVTRLASRVSKWTKFEDRQLFRRMSYLRHSAHLTSKGQFHRQKLTVHWKSTQTRTLRHARTPRNLLQESLS